MNSVFKSESYRYKRSKEVKAIAIVQLAIILLSTIAFWSSQNIAIIKKWIGSLFEATGPAHSFFDDMAGMADGMMFRILMLVMLVSLVTKLYQAGVMKQLVSSGIKRPEVILGQWAALTVTFSFIALVLGVVQGICNLILGGKFGLTEGNYGRLLLALVGMILSIACTISLYVLVSHLTGSMGATIVLGLAIELGAELALMSISMIFKTDVISRYYFGTMQANVTSLTGSVASQVKNMVGLVVYIVIFVALTQVVFSRKEIK